MFLARMSENVLTNSGDCKPPCLVPDLVGAPLLSHVRHAGLGLMCLETEFIT